MRWPPSWLGAAANCLAYKLVFGLTCVILERTPVVGFFVKSLREVRQTRKEKTCATQRRFVALWVRALPLGKVLPKVVGS